MGFFVKKYKLVKASQQNDIESVHRLLSEGQLVERVCNRRFRKQHRGRTALQAAAEHGHLEIMKILLDAGADVNRQNKGGCTALWLAAGRGNLGAVELLLQRGASATVPGCDEHGVDLRRSTDTPLHRAVYGQQFQDICERVRLSSTVSEGDNAPSVIHFRRLVVLLLRGGAKLHGQDGRGRTPLELAIGLGCVSAARVLTQIISALPEPNPKAQRLSRIYLQDDICMSGNT